MPYFVIFDGLLSYDHSANAQEFWQGQKDLVSPAGSVGASALRAEVSTGDPHPSTRSACRVFKLFNPSQNKKTPAGVFLFWQGQKDLNPRHAVLETAALPTELYPCVVGLRGLEPGTGRL